MWGKTMDSIRGFVKSPLVLVTSAVLLAALAFFDSNAVGSTRYVETTGDDQAGLNDCLTQAIPCRTIQHAVDAASAGDTVLVGAGTYDENPQIPKSLTLRSDQGRDLTTIRLAPVGTP